MVEFKQESTNRLVDNIFEYLREAILSGEIEPGTRLAAPSLAEKLGVSRSPVREAVQKLTRQRLAIESPRRGVVVARSELKDTLKLFELREALEGLAANLAARRASKSDIKKIHAAMVKHESLVGDTDIPERQNANMEFHSYIRDAADNSELSRSLEDLQAQIRLGMNVMKARLGADDLRNTVADHRAIYRGIANRDPAKAELAARAHIQRLHDRLLEILDEEMKQK